MHTLIVIKEKFKSKRKECARAPNIPKIYSFSALFDKVSAVCSQLSMINYKSAKNICKTPEGPEVEGIIIRDLPIQCNDIRYDGDRYENAVVVVEGDKGGENGRDIDGISRSSGIPHIFLDWSWFQVV